MGFKYNGKCPFRTHTDEKVCGSFSEEREIGVMQPLAKEHLEDPEAGRGQEGFLSRTFEGAWPC